MIKRFSVLLPLLFLLLVIGTHSSAVNLTIGANHLGLAAPQLSVYVLDIGQGDSLLIVSPTGKSVLIDTGDVGNEQNIINALINHAGGVQAATALECGLRAENTQALRS
jgi:beta-lactamase superfamily II metal-dependent hydrolase